MLTIAECSLTRKNTHNAECCQTQSLYIHHLNRSSVLMLTSQTQTLSEVANRFLRQTQTVRTEIITDKIEPAFNFSDEHLIISLFQLKLGKNPIHFIYRSS